VGWVKVMKEAIKNTGPFFSARRMVKEYTTKFYLNALKAAS
jgi:glycogen phosphorylase